MWKPLQGKPVFHEKLSVQSHTQASNCESDTEKNIK